MTNFAREHAHTNDIDTSHAAAERAEGMAARHKKMVYATLKRLGPLASEQIAGATGLNTLQVMKRVSDLRGEGVVVDSGERRPTETGRLAAVWKLKPAQLNLELAG
jgi:hypothetical protein